MSGDIEEALRLTTLINSKADEILAPLVLEMDLAHWRPEFQEILWNTIADKAKARAKRARTVGR